jgi:hypothetical protein
MPSLTLQMAQRFFRFLGVSVVDTGASSSKASMGVGPLYSATVGGPAAAAAALRTEGDGVAMGVGADAAEGAGAEVEGELWEPSLCLRSR